MTKISFGQGNYIVHPFWVSIPRIISHRALICKWLRVPEINSEELIVPTYVAWRSIPTNWVVLLAQMAGYQFLGSLKGLQIRAQYLGVGGRGLSCRSEVSTQRVLNEL